MFGRNFSRKILGESPVGFVRVCPTLVLWCQVQSCNADRWICKKTTKWLWDFAVDAWCYGLLLDTGYWSDHGFSAIKISQDSQADVMTVRDSVSACTVLVFCRRCSSPLPSDHMHLHYTYHTLLEYIHLWETSPSWLLFRKCTAEKVLAWCGRFCQQHRASLQDTRFLGWVCAGCPWDR